jgi:hypothetical protein
VDGVETEIYRANYIFRGIYVPAGQRTIRFSYQPLPFRVGAALGLITVAVLALLYYVLLARVLVRLALRGARAARRRLGEAARPAPERAEAPAGPADRRLPAGGESFTPGQASSSGA